MSDETPTTPEETPEVQETPKGETFSLEYVQQLRQEAAKYRNEKKTAVEEAVSKLTTELEQKLAAKDVEIAEATTNFSSRELELEKLKIAMRAVDQTAASRAEKLAELLKGSTEDEILSSAESAKELFGGFVKNSPAVDPTQGSGGGVIPLNGDPILQALKAAVKMT